jgi:hypothetical protein
MEKVGGEREGGERTREITRTGDYEEVKANRLDGDELKIESEERERERAREGEREK